MDNEVLEEKIHLLSAQSMKFFGRTDEAINCIKVSLEAVKGDVLTIKQLEVASFMISVNEKFATLTEEVKSLKTPAKSSTSKQVRQLMLAFALGASLFGGIGLITKSPMNWNHAGKILEKIVKST